MSKTYEMSADTTEWDEILIKKGITTRAEVLYAKGLNPADHMTTKELGLDGVLEAPKEYEQTLDDLNVEELDELDEEDEYADSRVLDEYRQRRLQEFQQAQRSNRFGEIFEIVKADWLREVNEASMNSWVLVHLYQDGLVECRLMDECLGALAKRFRYVKFIKIRSTQAVENWPDSKLPTLFLYRDGVLKTQSITLSQFGGKTMKPEDVEWWLAGLQVVTDSELNEDPRQKY